MKVVLAGAYGNLGADIFKCLLTAGHQVVAADMMERDMGVSGDFTFRKIDVTDPESLKGLCDGADVVITTVGLTKTSATVTNYQIDYQGNLNLLNEVVPPPMYLKRLWGKKKLQSCFEKYCLEQRYREELRKP